MKKPKILRLRGTIALFLALGLLTATTFGGFAQETVQPPVAEKIKKELTIHGQTRIDNYYWLNERTNPKVIDYLKAENVYAEAMMKPTEGLQEKLYNELVGRIKQTDMSVPYFENGYWYYTRYESGKDYPGLLPQGENPAGEGGGPPRREQDGRRTVFFQYRRFRHQP